MIKINEEFKKLIPALSVEEFKQLEANCLEDGIMNPLVFWNDVIIDGHNRYNIAVKHELQFESIYMEFEDEEAAKMWIINNQLGRRNINSYQRSVLALEYEAIFSKKAKANLEESGKQSTNLINRSLQKSANSDEPPASMALPTLPNLGLAPIDTRKEIAKIANVSHDTISKVKTIEAHATPEIKKLLSSGEMSINKAFHDVQELIKSDLKAEMLQTTEISPREAEMIEKLKAGETVVINMKTDLFVLDWATKNDRFEKIDRNTDWGNPFILNEDGDRDTVCNSFEFHYLPNKPGLLKRVDTLKGKALGCWCAPLNCHGNSLKRLSDETAT